MKICVMHVALLWFVTKTQLSAQLSEYETEELIKILEKQRETVSQQEVVITEVRFAMELSANSPLTKVQSLWRAGN